MGPYVKITQGRTLQILQSRWGLPSGCPQLSSATFTPPAACRPRGAGRALLLLPLQMLTTVPPPVAGSACRGSVLSLTQEASNPWGQTSSWQVWTIMNQVNIFLRLNVFNSLSKCSSKLQVLGQMHFSFKGRVSPLPFLSVKVAWTLFEVATTFFSFFVFLKEKWEAMKMWEDHVQRVFSLEKASAVQSQAFRFPPM